MNRGLRSACALALLSFACSREPPSGLNKTIAPPSAAAPALAPNAAPAAPLVKDACSVASAADIGSAFGGTFIQTQDSPDNVGRVSRCDWKKADPLLLVSVHTASVDRATFEYAVRAAPRVELVSGLGDVAYLQLPAYQLLAYKGTISVSVNCVGLNDASKMQAAQKALMATIMAKL